MFFACKRINFRINFSIFFLKLFLKTSSEYLLCDCTPSYFVQIHLVDFSMTKSLFVKITASCTSVSGGDSIFTFLRNFITFLEYNSSAGSVFLRSRSLLKCFKSLITSFVGVYGNTNESTSIQCNSTNFSLKKGIVQQ